MSELITGQKRSARCTEFTEADVTAVVVHGHHQIHAVTHAGLIVVSAEARSSVDTAGTAVHGDVLSQNERPW